jgi:hypothetical protein
MYKKHPTMDDLYVDMCVYIHMLIYISLNTYLGLLRGIMDDLLDVKTVNASRSLLIEGLLSMSKAD